jgi:hypothetical protein
VPCNPPPGPARTSPRREEITTQHEMREDKNSRGLARMLVSPGRFWNSFHGYPGPVDGR